jgi:hypothetical protein
MKEILRSNIIHPEKKVKVLKMSQNKEIIQFIMIQKIIIKQVTKKKTA